MKKILISLLVILLTTANSCFSSNTDKPNIIIILTDDQGYADLGCFGSKAVKTPRIDQMAKEGAILSTFYMAASVCTPSRAALLTGSYPKRIGMTGILVADSKAGLNPNEITIAEVVKSAGYKTAMYGKWHLGHHPDFLPTRQGFDEFFGLPYSHDIHPFHPRKDVWNFPKLPLIEGEKVIELEPDADFLTQRITQKAIDFIKRNKDNPFFLYVAHPMPHVPLHVSPNFMQQVPKETRDLIQKNEKAGNFIDYETRGKIFPQVISEIDWSVGQLLDELKKQGIDDNTLVLFTSDNGPSKPKLSSAYPLRGYKSTVYEGGMREPTVIRWPSKIKAGQKINQLMTAMDLFPTIAQLVGYQILQDRVIDGKNILPVLTKNEASPHQYFFYHKRTKLMAIRNLKWKLHLSEGKADALYNLDDDIRESKNLINEQPLIVEQLLSVCKNFEKEIKANYRPNGIRYQQKNQLKK